jgi:FdhD protein
VASSTGPVGITPDPLQILGVDVQRVEAGRRADATDEVAVEEPFEIRIGGTSVALIMRTPGDDRSLAAGFLFAEGFIRSADDVLTWAAGLDRDGFPDANILDLGVRPDLDVSALAGQRNFPVSASCGLCGKASIEATRLRLPAISSSATVTTEILHGLDAKLRAAQPVFARTGGLHAAAVFDLDGKLLLASEDVGRHNAVDKVIGRLLRERRLPASAHLLMVSGRVSFELVQKAAVAGIPIFVAVGAPSSLAVEMAAACEMTLVGMLRSGRFVVYSRADRIAPDAGACSSANR